ncbi:serine/threonine-protein kinase [Actinoplanes sp. NPDC051633]|uniref:serine/threonine-protein kinase n=1 Tax=Actinoplanes sp. NPDC051633 TaxID=3155670 RepID=UPI0034155C73
MIDTAIDLEDGEPVWAFAENAMVAGGYRAWERLGVGIRCETWLVWSPRLWAPAVLKLPRPHLATHPRATQSLSREVSALRDNPHPVLPRLYGSGFTDEMHYIAVEYVDGPTLADEIDDGGTILAAEVALLGIQVLTALRTLHQRGLAHVDVKPDNIVIRDGRPVLIDFGSAREIGAKQPAGRPVGTAGYAPPEMEACEPISAAMDVYALGVTLREAGGKPGGPLADVLDRMTADDPVERPSTHAALVALGTLVPDDLRPWPAWATR